MIQIGGRLPLCQIGHSYRWLNAGRCGLGRRKSGDGVRPAMEEGVQLVLFAEG
jgi:hypothetical protein